MMRKASRVGFIKHHLMDGYGMLCMVFDWTQSVAKCNFKLRLPLFSMDYSEISIWLGISSRLCKKSSINALVDA